MNQVIYESLEDLLAQNIDYFSQNQGHSTSDLLLQNFIRINDNLKHVKTVAKTIG